MRKALLLAGFALVCASLGGLVVRAATAGTPEIDRANATLGLQGNLKTHGCVGEDNTDYVTYTGTWTGSESQITPDATDYGLSGTVVVKSIKWTINSNTSRGVLTGSISLTSAASNTPIYSGKLTLVTQGKPAAGATVPGRGWISALFQPADDGVAPPGDDNLIANVEFALSLSGATGQFGDAAGSLAVPDFSAVTNVAPSAKDGTC